MFYIGDIQDFNFKRPIHHIGDIETKCLQEVICGKADLKKTALSEHFRPIRDDGGLLSIHRHEHLFAFPGG